tara:strand:+ start:9809 stop:11677 length:1869 start_codon:yes stop_codon:yes gene_type:complete
MATNYITETNKLKIAELDFDSIKTALKTFLRGQTEFADYDFEGSAINILLDVLAYNTHYNGFYTNMLASEMFMDSASLRSSIVSLAKHLGYTPSSKRGSTIDLDVVFEGASENVPITIPRNAKFTTRIGPDAYTFLTTQARTSIYNSTTGKHEVINLQITEGISFSETYTVQGNTNETFVIPNEDVDTTTLIVAAGGEIFTKADDLTEISSTSKVYFLQEGNQNRYEIYFGDGVVGKKPSISEIVQITYNASQLGTDGNGARTFFLAETVSGATSVDLTLSSGYTRSAGGSERETTSSIKIQAPRQFGLQKRLVTTNDYKTRLENDYTLVDSVRVWGGEDNNPPEFGTVYVSVKPRTGYVLSQAEQYKIANDIIKKRNVVTVNTRFVEPDYLFVAVNSTISFDPRQTSRNASQLSNLVKARILNYSTTQLTRFEDYFRYTALTKMIDETEFSIKNNTTTIAMKKRILPELKVRRRYELEFNNALNRPHAGHAPVLRSSLFTYGGVENCYITDRDGILRIVLSQRGDSGDDLNDTSMSDYGVSDNRIIEDNIGQVDYTTGEVAFTSHISKLFGNETYLYFIAQPAINDIIPQKNTFITIDTSDVQVLAIDDNNRIQEDRVRSY